MSGRGSSPRVVGLAPGFVVAMPQLQDPNFTRTVVLMLRSNEEGALGVVVNRSTSIPLGEFLAHQNVEFAGGPEHRLNLGGPVEQDSHLLVLHGEEEPLMGEGSPEELELAPGLRLIVAREGLRVLAARNSRRFRCYLGYAGWGPGQLEWELSEGAWVALPCDSGLVFDEPQEDVWHSALRQAGIDPISLVPGGALN